MTPFFAMAWNADDDEASRYVTEMKRRISLDAKRSYDCVEGHGFSVYAELPIAPTASGLMHVPAAAGECGGAIFGKLFSNSIVNGRYAAMSRIPLEEGTQLCGTLGASLSRKFWGSYIGFFRYGPAFAFVTDPMASVPCFYTRKNGVVLAFSHLEACDFIDKRAFTINYQFISELLAYDKIQTGETGLNEISELLGGQRLLIHDGCDEREHLWDPKSVALDVHEPPSRAAKAELRETTIAAIGAWGASFDAIVLELSGGLDSSIVLSSLAQTVDVKKITCVHHKMQSSDPAENKFAREAATQWDCRLEEVSLDPSRALPEATEHPLSVRPYRQFAAGAVPGLMEQYQPRQLQAYFTGQGGDHLFLTSRSNLVFADYLRNHGVNPKAFRELLHAARQNEQSIWAVLSEAVPRIFGGDTENMQLANIRRRRTTVNTNAYDDIQVDSMFPSWALSSARVPPAKLAQVRSLLHLMHVRHPFYRASGAPTVHPLTSQPIMELCLRFPTYLLRLDGRNRGLAREAFSGLIPDSIRTRYGKGDASRYFVENLVANKEMITGALENGALVSEGLISPQNVHAFMHRNSYRTHEFGRMMIIYYCIEAWLRKWRAITKPDLQKTSDILMRG